MKRIEGASGRRARPLARIALRIARRKTRQIAGAETERMIEPLEAYAHLPRLMVGYGALEEATARLHGVDHRLKVLAELKAATLSQCEYCVDLGSQICRNSGLSDEELLALPRYRESELFGELEKLVLDYAVGMSSTPVDVSDELFAKVRDHFDEAQIVELTNIVALENMRGRFNGALGIGSSGFREGLVCAVPDRAPARESGPSEANGATAAAGAPSTTSAA
jgi:4-carboxymuconolactone decarboxylase